MPIRELEGFGRVASDWKWQTGAKGELLYVSADAVNWFGCPASELVGKSYEATAFNGEPSLNYIAATVDLKPFKDLAYTYYYPDRKPRWFTLTGEPTYDEAGCFNGCCGVGRDVSDRHQTRAAFVATHSQLIEQNRRFDAALENMSQGLCMFDASGSLMVWNRRYLEIFGLSSDKIYVGLSQRKLVEILISLQRYKIGTTLNEICDGTRISLENETSKSVLRELASGCVVAVNYRSMIGGGWVATFEDVTERFHNEKRIVHMALHDALTGLANRTLFRDRLEQVIARARQVHTSFAVLACDLDRFKAVNDSLGHLAGDALLCVIAERMRAVLRPYDTIARLGGDEFAIVLTYLDDPEEAADLAERLIAAVSQPIDLEGQSVEVGVSIGLTVATDQDHDPDELFKRADIALYEAKAAGRNTYREFEPDVGSRIATRGQLALDLKDAIRRDAFHLVYQPVVDAATGTVVSMEALMRWRHPVQGDIRPDAFIPVAEETGLIVPLGAWALQEACREAVGWPALIRVAVNVSAVQLRRPGFEAIVSTALSASGLPANRLKLEVTESVLMQDGEAIIAILHRLRALGVLIALDDFGTGYSSLSYLRRFPFDKIKIDRSFIRDIADPNAAAIVRAVVGIGERLGMGIVAEGVETREQLDLVRREGCTQVQGYLFSRPLPPEEARAYVRN